MDNRIGRKVIVKYKNIPYSGTVIGICYEDVEILVVAINNNPHKLVTVYSPNTPQGYPIPCHQCEWQNQP